MYNFSGLIFRIWGVAGIIFVIGIICMLIGKPWENGLHEYSAKFGVIALAFAVCLAGFYVSRVVSADVSSHTGEFVETQRNSRSAPPLPVTYEYVFSGDDKNKVFYLDTFSKKEVIPYEFEIGQKYTVYYDNITNIIVKVEPAE